jgi:hypothetical protein
MYSSVDQVAVATYLANKSVERALSSKLEDARDAVTNKVVDILTAYKNSMTGGGGGGQLAIADNMKMLPVLSLGLLKHVSSEFQYFVGVVLIGGFWCRSPSARVQRSRLTCGRTRRRC